MKHLYKLSYIWFEGDHDQKYIISDLNQKEFEKLLVDGIKTINEFETIPHYSEPDRAADKHVFSVRCLPEAFEHIIRWLEEHGCDIIYIHPLAEYTVEDYGVLPKFHIERVETEVTMTNIVEESDGKNSKE